MKQTLVLLVFLFSSAAHADESVTCNKHGAVVSLENGTVLYMGKDCDAIRKGGDKGFWWNAASFLAVDIEGDVYRVAVGQGIDCLPFCELP